MSSLHELTLCASPELMDRLRVTARLRGETLETAAVRLLEKSTGVYGRRARVQRFATMTSNQAEAFEAAFHAETTFEPPE